MFVFAAVEALAGGDFGGDAFVALVAHPAFEAAGEFGDDGIVLGVGASEVGQFEGVVDHIVEFDGGAMLETLNKCGGVSVAVVGGGAPGIEEVEISRAFGDVVLEFAGGVEIEDEAAFEMEVEALGVRLRMRPWG